MNAALYPTLQAKLLETGDKFYIQLFLFLDGDKLATNDGDDGMYISK
mgnify:CR=1 FL=1